jgi:hypothetical protein
MNFSVSQGLIAADISSETVYLGDYARMTVTASPGVTMVKLTDTAANISYEQSYYTSSGLNRVFAFDIKTTETGRKTYTIDIGSPYSYVRASKTLSLLVQTVPNVPIAVDNISFNSRTYPIGERVPATVRTSTSAVELQVYDAQTRATTTYTSYKESGNYRTFDISVNTSVRGTNSYTVTAFDAGGAKASKTFSLSVGTGYYNDSNYSNYGYYDSYGVFHYYSDYYNDYYRTNYGYYDDYGIFRYYYDDNYRYLFEQLFGYQGYYDANYGMFINSIIPQNNYNYGSYYGLSVITRDTVSYVTIRAGGNDYACYQYQLIGGNQRQWDFEWIPRDSGAVLISAYGNNGYTETRSYYPY